MILLLKPAIPGPSSVLLVPPIVGFGFVAQQTPFAVMFAPPSEAIVPPETADVKVIEVTVGVVVTVAVAMEAVVNESSFPYPVPALLVAYAR